MENVVIANGRREYERIDKRRARYFFNKGVPIVMCPCNLEVGEPFHYEVKVERNELNENFDEIVRKAAYLCEKREKCKVFVKIFAMLI